MKHAISGYRARWIIAVCCNLAFLCTCQALAIAPRYVSDEELAAYPIIVVGKWDKAPAVAHHQYEGNDATGKAIVKIEVYTRLNVLTVIKGKVEPGMHDLLLGGGITWADDGTFLNSGTSTQLLGDVDDVTKPCVWFLRRTRSWDPKLKDGYLTAKNYREVQPLELKVLYVALGGRDAQTEVPKLLAADKPIVARRVLLFMCGGMWPQPYGNDCIYDKPEKRGDLLRGAANRVWAFLRTAGPSERGLAASVYAELAGKEGLAKMHTLLDDNEPNMRGIAVCVLAAYRDEASLDRFAKATQGLQDGVIACQVIKALAAWKDERAVPALIGFLQSDEFAYQDGYDIGIPALKAWQALTEITGHQFPFDVEASQKAWQDARSIHDKSARKRLLEQLAPGGGTPLVAAAVGLPAKELSGALKDWYGPLGEGEVVIKVRFRNVSSRPVTILKYPTQVESQSPAGCKDYGSLGAASPGKIEKLEFVTIQPDRDLAIEAIVDEGFLIADPATRRLRISYLSNGHRQNVKAWIGNIDVDFGSDWKYAREVKHVEEFWKSGNLKATGKTVNGVKLDEWNYFNEQGDRIRVEYPGTGRGTAICNPDYPTNKGAGKPQPK